MDRGAVFVACVAAAVSTLAMGLYANYPTALAPGMGLNAFFAFTVVITYKYTWQQALAAVFLSGVLLFLILVSPIRLHRLRMGEMSINGHRIYGYHLRQEIPGRAGRT
jgi:AGZA family xanthine/uracil permease-like MFS transporter